MNVSFICDKRKWTEQQYFLSKPLKKQKLAQDHLFKILHTAIAEKLSCYLHSSDWLNLQSTNKNYEKLLDPLWKNISFLKKEYSFQYKDLIFPVLNQENSLYFRRKNKLCYLSTAALINYLIYDLPLLRGLRNYTLISQIEKKYKVFTDLNPLFEAYLFKSFASVYPSYFFKIVSPEKVELLKKENLLQAFVEYENYYILTNAKDKKQSLDKMKELFILSLKEENYLTSFLALYVLWEEVDFDWHLNLIFKCAERGNQKSLIVLIKILTNSISLTKILTDLLHAIKTNPQFAQLLIFQEGAVLQYASDELKNDREIVKVAVQQNGKALEFASNELKNDREIVKLAVQKNREALEFASDELKNDREIVKVAVQQSGEALKFASDKLKNDQEIVKLAIQKEAGAFYYASNRLKNNLELVELAVTKKGEILNKVSRKLRANPKVIKLAVQQTGKALCFASKKLRNDLEIAKLAIQQNGEAWYHVSGKIKEDLKFLKWALLRNPYILADLPENLKDNFEIVKLAVQQKGKTLFFASNRLKNDQEIVKLALQQNGEALYHASIKLKNDREIVKLAVQQNGIALEFASNRLKNDREIARLAVQQKGEALEFVSDELKNDREIVELALQKNGYALQFASEKLKKNLEIVKLAIKKEGRVFQLVFKDLEDISEKIQLKEWAVAKLIAQEANLAFKSIVISDLEKHLNRWLNKKQKKILANFTLKRRFFYKAFPSLCSYNLEEI